MPTVVKILGALQRLKVDKGVAEVAIGFGVDLEVEEIELVFEVCLDLVHQHVLAVFVGNVLYHECGFPVLHNLFGNHLDLVLARVLRVDGQRLLDFL